LPGWDYRQWVAVIEHPELRESFYRKLRHLQAAGCSWSMAVALASSELHGEGVGRGLVEPLPLAASTGRTAAFTGLAIITLRRLVRGHPDFPRPYKLTERGDLRWPLPEIVAWLEGKAGRPLTRG
jgi:predicted DNA-binding transcriptional regulator AlpA